MTGRIYIEHPIELVGDMFHFHGGAMKIRKTTVGCGVREVVRVDCYQLRKHFLRFHGDVWIRRPTLERIWFQTNLKKYLSRIWKEKYRYNNWSGVDE